MSEQDNLNIVRKLIDGFNSHNLETTVQYLADNVKGYDPGTPEPMDKQEIRRYNQRFLDAFPDLHFDLKDLIAQGDKVSVSWVARGTHKSPFKLPTGETIPATNKTVHVPGVTVGEIHNGMITRQDIYYDQVTFLTQLGLLTPQELASVMRR